MPEKKRSSKNKTSSQITRKYEANTLTLEALRLIAAPNPKDDLTDEEFVTQVKKNKFSTEMIQQIIDTVKAL